MKNLILILALLCMSSIQAMEPEEIQPSSFVKDLILKRASETGNKQIDDICSICRSDFEEGDVYSSLPCNHTLHFNCFQNMCKTSNECALCRKKIDLEQKEQLFKNPSGIVLKDDVLTDKYIFIPCNPFEFLDTQKNESTHMQQQSQAFSLALIMLGKKQQQIEAEQENVLREKHRIKMLMKLHPELVNLEMYIEGKREWEAKAIELAMHSAQTEEAVERMSMLVRDLLLERLKSQAQDRKNISALGAVLIGLMSSSAADKYFSKPKSYLLRNALFLVSPVLVSSWLFNRYINYWCQKEWQKIQNRMLALAHQ